MEAMQLFAGYLNHLGFGVGATEVSSLSYRAPIPLQPTPQATSTDYYLQFFYCESNADVQSRHLEVWNSCETMPFVAVLPGKTVLIDSRVKPSSDPNRIEGEITTFSYGVGANYFEIESDLKNRLGKSAINFDFLAVLAAKRRETVRNSIDKDLLLNLLHLKEDLVCKAQMVEEKAQMLLILCLFVKFLEDRGMLQKDGLFDAIRSADTSLILTYFGRLKKLNGDLFKGETLESEDLPPKALEYLGRFFGNFDYRTGTGRFFPYQFDRIPIQLIGSIYESFLSDQTKEKLGVYYTPRNLVRFMLSIGMPEGNALMATANTILDPACGSGAFLVEVFSRLIDSHQARNSFYLKKKILENQVFGIDIDPRAIRIAAFSLYLELLNGEDPQFIKAKIDEEEAIFPNLIGRTLIAANSLLDPVQFLNGSGSDVSKFDIIIGNPPWGFLKKSNESSPGANDIRRKVDLKKKEAEFKPYDHVVSYQMSQLFLLRAQKWCHPGSIITMVVNSAVFLNADDDKFRAGLMGYYNIETVFMLASINHILFKNEELGKVGEKVVAMGAGEPCTVVQLKLLTETSTPIQYVRPKPSPISDWLKIIAFGSADIVLVNQIDFQKEDRLWRIFAIGNWADYHLLQKRIASRDGEISVDAKSGIKPKETGQRKAPEQDLWPLVNGAKVARWQTRWDDLETFDRNKKIDRERVDETIFTGDRILAKQRIQKSELGRLTFARISMNALHKNNCHSLKIIQPNGKYPLEFALGLLNSNFATYFFYLTSSQLGKTGDFKRESLQIHELNSFPFPKLEAHDDRPQAISDLVHQIEKKALQGEVVTTLEAELDKLVLDLYAFNLYERMVIDEFIATHFGQLELHPPQATLFGHRQHPPQISIRARTTVEPRDLQKYAAAFESSIGLLLHKEVLIKSRYQIFKDLGTMVCFSFLKRGSQESASQIEDLFALLKKSQLDQLYASNLLREEKLKWYDNENQRLYILKTSQYIDWTDRKAMDDAKEEAQQMVRHLMTAHGTQFHR